MCFGGAPQDNSAEIARQQEAERQARVQAGTARINDAFSKFDDSYYSGLGKSYLNYYTPELERQYGDAQKKLTYGFADAGNLESGAANQKMADLGREYGVQRAQLSDRALGAQQQGQADVERNRSDLISQLEAGSGVESTATSALARAQSLSAPPQYSPLGDVFATFTNTLANNAALQARGYPGLTIPGASTSPTLLGSKGSGSVRTVS